MTRRIALLPIAFLVAACGKPSGYPFALAEAGGGDG